MDTSKLYKPRRIKDSSPVSIYFSEGTRKKVEELANKYDASMSRIVETLLDEALEREMKDGKE